MDKKFEASVSYVRTVGTYPLFSAYSIGLNLECGTPVSVLFKDFGDKGKPFKLEGKRVEVTGFSLDEADLDDLGSLTFKCASDTVSFVELETDSNLDKEESKDPTRIAPKVVDLDIIKEDVRRLGNVAYEAVKEALLVHAKLSKDYGLPLQSESIQQTGTSIFIQLMRSGKWALTEPTRTYISESDARAIVDEQVSKLSQIVTSKRT